jgi:hypothetical protein
MAQSKITLEGTNLEIVPLEDAQNDVDFKSFIQASKDSMKTSVQYLVFFKTEAAHVGINGNGIRFFPSDLKQDKPFLYAPAKYEHGGPIVGTIISGKYKTNDEGIGTIETKGVLWILENSYAVSDLIQGMVRNPDMWKTSMECYYNAPDKCEYGIGDKKITYEKFQTLADYKGSDYNGKGIVWQRASNPTFTGLAFTMNPADRKTDVSLVNNDELGVLQRAYASITKQEVIEPVQVDKVFCPVCAAELNLSTEEAAAKISDKSWGDVDKTKLPKSCFLYNPGTEKSKWKFPVYEGTGTMKDGMYTQRGMLNREGVKTAMEYLGKTSDAVRKVVEPKLNKLYKMCYPDSPKMKQMMNADLVKDMLQENGIEVGDAIWESVLERAQKEAI